MKKEVLTPKELAERWGMNRMTLYKWRSKSRGPRYIKLGMSKGSAILYRLKDIEAYEKKYMVDIEGE